MTSGSDGTHDTTRFPDLSALAGILGGERSGAVSTEHAGVSRISSIAIDSRQVVGGSLFFALPGAVTDGERFVDDAIASGAVAAVVRRKTDPGGKPWRCPVIVVEDTLTALHRLACWYADTHLRRVTRIGITGSNGKTTTKELVCALLEQIAPTFGSRGNYNSETGLPLSIFDTPRDVTFAVYEMAMSAPGEMTALARIVRPDYAIITNIGTAHIGRLGSRDAIAQEKKAITDYFTGEQVLLVPETDDYVEFLSHDVEGQVVYFGPNVQHVTIEERGRDGLILKCSDRREIFVPIPGRHNGINALAALRLAEILGRRDLRFDGAVRLAELPSGRAERYPLPKGGLLVHDGYNANPDSMSAALTMIRDIHRRDPASPSLVLVLGDMYELGEWTESAHRRVLAEAWELRPALLCLVGELFAVAWNRFSTETAGDGSAPATETLCVPSAERLAGALRDRLAGSEIVLFKGSNGIGLGRIVPVVTKEVITGV